MEDELTHTRTLLDIEAVDFTMSSMKCDASIAMVSLLRPNGGTEEVEEEEEEDEDCGTSGAVVSLSETKMSDKIQGLNTSLEDPVNSSCPDYNPNVGKGGSSKRLVGGRSPYHSIQRLLSPGKTGGNNRPRSSPSGEAPDAGLPHPRSYSEFAFVALSSSSSSSSSSSTSSSSSLSSSSLCEREAQQKRPRTSVGEDGWKDKNGRRGGMGEEGGMEDDGVGGGGVINISTHDLMGSIGESSQSTSSVDQLSKSSFGEEEDDDDDAAATGISDKEDEGKKRKKKRKKRDEAEARSGGKSDFNWRSENHKNNGLEKEELLTSLSMGEELEEEEDDDDEEEEMEAGASSSGSDDDTVEAKRRRMELIVATMKQSSVDQTQPKRILDPTRPKRKQYIPKQHDSQRSRIEKEEDEDEDEEEEDKEDEHEEEEEVERGKTTKKIRTVAREELQVELDRLQQRLFHMKQKYIRVFGEIQDPVPLPSLKRKRDGPEVVGRQEVTSPDERSELKHLAGVLKAELISTIGILVDDVFRGFVERQQRQCLQGSYVGRNSPEGPTPKVIPVKTPGEATNGPTAPSPVDEKPDCITEDASAGSSLDLKPQFLYSTGGLQGLHSTTSASVSSSPIHLPQPLRPQPCSIATDLTGFVRGFPSLLQPKPVKSKLLEKFVGLPMFDHHPHPKTSFDSSRTLLPPPPPPPPLHPQSLPPPIFSPAFYHHHHPHHHPSHHPVPLMAAAAVAAGIFTSKEPEQTEAIPLVVNTPTKKKRTKVTDTRLSPRAAKAILHDNRPTTTTHRPGTSLSHATRDEEPASRHHDDLGGVEIGRQRRCSADDVCDQGDGPFGQFRSHHPCASLHRHQHHPLGPPPPQHPSLLPSSLPTSVAIPNPSLQLQSEDLMRAIYAAHHRRLDLVLQPPTDQRFASSAAGGHDLLVAAGQISGQLRSASSSPEVGMTSSDRFVGSIKKTEAVEGYDKGSSFEVTDHSMTFTLTPMHLRKAKLMFFYVRYPSSSVLKVYFPDVKFNKNNTAQLIKWFSNFREFFYIQMEKYARQALAEGIKNAGDLVVTSDSELYRVLVLHYNRNNRIEVPDSFRQTVQATLREFFKSIQSEKDQESSWKKSIYKIIAHLDDTVPEHFKSTNWMEQLADA